MQIDLKNIKENKDGSADVEVCFDKEGMALMIQWGLVAMLKEAVKNESFNPTKKSKPCKITKR